MIALCRIELYADGTPMTSHQALAGTDLCEMHLKMRVVFINVQRAQEIAQISQRTLYNWMDWGWVEFVREGRRRRVNLCSLLQVCEAKYGSRGHSYGTRGPQRPGAGRGAPLDGVGAG